MNLKGMSSSLFWLDHMCWSKKPCEIGLVKHLFDTDKVFKLWIFIGCILNEPQLDRRRHVGFMSSERLF